VRKPPGLLGEEAAVDRKRDAGDETGVRGEEEGNARGDLGGLCQATERDRRGQLLLRLLELGATAATPAPTTLIVRARKEGS